MLVMLTAAVFQQLSAMTKLVLLFLMGAVYTAIIETFAVNLYDNHDLLQQTHDG